MSHPPRTAAYGRRALVAALVGSVLVLPRAAAAGESVGWPFYGNDLGAQRYSELRSIDATNVAQLSLAWVKPLGPPMSMEGTPIVVGRTMYVTTGNDDVYALDAATGATRWHAPYVLPDDATGEACCNFNNRGVTVSGNTVVNETLDAHLIARDRRNGKLLWDATLADYRQGYSLTSPPLPVRGMLVSGIAGGEFPTRGFIAAYDAKTGAERWRRATVPLSQPAGEAVAGGAPTWVQGSYDARLDTIYWGVGNPNPDLDVAPRHGADRYADSILALDAKSGAIRWSYKLTPDDIWDYDGVNESILADVPARGRIDHLLAHADRNGYLFVLDRITGTLRYAQPFVDRITWATIDRTTGRVHPNRTMRETAEAGKSFVAYPGNFGGKNWGPMAYDPRRRMLVIPAIEAGSVFAPDHAPRATKMPRLDLLARVRALFARIARRRSGGTAQMKLGGRLDFSRIVAHGSVAAYDLASGVCRWKRRYDSPLVGGALATAGDLIFFGLPEGRLEALDARTGRTLWSARTPSGITAPPITYSIDGRQYVAVEVGIGGPWSGAFAPAVPSLRTVPGASLVYAYALPNRAPPGLPAMYRHKPPGVRPAT